MRSPRMSSVPRNKLAYSCSIPEVQAVRCKEISNAKSSHRMVCKIAEWGIKLSPEVAETKKISNHEIPKLTDFWFQCRIPQNLWTIEAVRKRSFLSDFKNFASKIEKHVRSPKSGTYVVVICLFYRVILVKSNRPCWRDKAQKVTSRRLASKTELITLCYVMERPALFYGCHPALEISLSAKLTFKHF